MRLRDMLANCVAANAATGDDLTFCGNPTGGDDYGRRNRRGYSLMVSWSVSARFSRSGWHEVHIGVARSGQFAMQRVGARPAHSSTGSRWRNRFWIANAGIGSSGIDMHEHRLSLAGRQRVAAGHVHGDDLVRAEDDFRMLAAVAVPARDLLDQRDMIGAQIGEDIFDAEVDQSFEEIMRGGVTAHARESLCFLAASRPCCIASEGAGINSCLPAKLDQVKGHAFLSLDRQMGERGTLSGRNQFRFLGALYQCIVKMSPNEPVRTNSTNMRVWYFRIRLA